MNPINDYVVKVSDDNHQPPMSHRHLLMFMAQAYTIANRSYAKDLKVGALLVKPLPDKTHRIISDGYNGTEVGEDNCCEFPSGQSKPSVLCAERNLFRKVMRSQESSVGCTLFVTRTPCANCAERIIDAGVTHVVFCEEHRDKAPLNRLADRGVALYRIPKTQLICYFDAISTRLRQPKFNEPQEATMESCTC